jgi:hypothetical protein
MVAAGYVNNDHDDNHDGPRQGNNYYGSSSRSVGRDSRPRTEWRRRRDAPPLSAEEMLNGGCTRHTYINKDGRRKPAHLLIECREFLRLSQALQDKMRTEQPVAGSVAYNVPPPPPNPPANVVQQSHHDLACLRTVSAGHQRRGVSTAMRLRADDPERMPDKSGSKKAW